eukprot:1473474-Amphidinium_carterae.1
MLSLPSCSTTSLLCRRPSLLSCSTTSLLCHRLTVLFCFTTSLLCRSLSVLLALVGVFVFRVFASAEEKSGAFLAPVATVEGEKLPLAATMDPCGSIVIDKGSERSSQGCAAQQKKFLKFKGMLGIIFLAWTLASILRGGCVHFALHSTAMDYLQWKGRWNTQKSMRHYLQMGLGVAWFSRLEDAAKSRVM